MRPARASAPGKLILMGEHAAVFGRPAVIAAIDLRVTVTVRESSIPGLRLELPDLKAATHTSWEAVRRYARAVRGAWQRRQSSGSQGGLNSGRNQPTRVVLLALGETARAMPPGALRGMVVTVESDLPISTGCGSSAAVAVAVAAAALEALGVEPDRERVAAIALECERRQHGTPSGVDHGTILAGGIQWAERDATGELRLSPLTPRAERLARLEVYATGSSRESTGEVVAAVAHLAMQKEAKVQMRLAEMENATRAFLAWLTDEAIRDMDLFQAVRCYEAALESLGVVPESVRRRVRQIESSGGAAKLSGAGALTGEGAGALLVWPGEGSDSVAAVRELPRLDVGWGAPGLEVERLA